MKRWIALLIALTVASSQGIPPVFRLHVIVNSDSAEDQAVKLKVRDAIIEQMGDMDGAADREQAEAYTKEHLQELVERANRVLRENGFSHTATAEIGSFDFPDKTYGGICFPADTMRAADSSGQSRTKLVCIVSAAVFAGTHQTRQTGRCRTGEISIVFLPTCLNKEDKKIWHQKTGAAEAAGIGNRAVGCFYCFPAQRLRRNGEFEKGSQGQLVKTVQQKLKTGAIMTAV
ncbi:MAG: stage II sporulation protein R [Christensenellales bacterium]